MNMKPRKKTKNTINERTEAMDRISQLPDDIIHQIFAFLPTRSVFRTSVLSKRWQCALASYPVVHFTETMFGKELSLKNQDRDTQHKRNKFMDFVDRSLQRLGKSRTKIERFELDMTFSDWTLASRIDHWIELISTYSLQKLDLSIKYKDLYICYTMPQIVYAAKSLVLLRLRGCSLKELPRSETIEFSCLKELSLMDVEVKEHCIHNIIYGCPLIENLTLSRCRGIRYLLLCRLHKLNKIEVHQCSPPSIRIRSIEVDAPNLRTLHYRGSNQSLCRFDIAACKNLVELSIKDDSLYDKLFQNPLIVFPHLESLDLQTYIDKKIEISGLKLKKLSFCDKFSVVLKIDTPNLCSFRYICYGETMPALLAMEPSNLERALMIELYVKHNIIYPNWFHKMREFLGRFGENKKLTLKLKTFCSQVSFNYGCLRKTPVPPLYKLNHLEIDLWRPTTDCQELIDGLLWSCHPETLCIASGWRSNNKLIEGLCKNLQEETNPNCCSYMRINCWRHDLRGFQIKVSVRENDKQTIKTIECNALIESLPTLAPHKKIRFHFNW